jgi:hypothetical protein
MHQSLLREHQIRSFQTPSYYRLLEILAVAGVALDRAGHRLYVAADDLAGSCGPALTALFNGGPGRPKPPAAAPQAPVPKNPQVELLEQQLRELRAQLLGAAQPEPAPAPLTKQGQEQAPKEQHPRSTTAAGSPVSSAPAPISRASMAAVLTGVKEGVKLKGVARGGAAGSGGGAAANSAAAAAPPTPSLGVLLGKRFAAVNSLRKPSPSSPDSLAGEESDFAFSPPPMRPYANGGGGAAATTASCAGASTIARAPARAFLGEIVNGGGSGLRPTPAKRAAVAAEAAGKPRVANSKAAPLTLAQAVASSAARRGLPAAEI